MSPAQTRLRSAIPPVLCAVAALGLAPAAQALTVVDIAASHTNSLRAPTGYTYNDNRLRVYDDGSGEYAIEGWLQFDLSAIPDAATISALTLTLTAAGGANDPAFYVGWNADDDWGPAAPTVSSSTAVSEVSTAAQPGARQTLALSLDPTAFDVVGDLADDAMTLTLVMTDLSSYAYRYFYGAEGVAEGEGPTSSGDYLGYVPTLSVSYEASAVPLPAAAPLLAAGLGALAWAGRRRRG